jgi:hypothetical protein
MFDSDFDNLMNEADEEIWSNMGISVCINDGEPVTAVYEEDFNEFDTVAGAVKQFKFLAISGVTIKAGDTIKNMSSGQVATVVGSPISINGEIQVTVK